MPNYRSVCALMRLSMSFAALDRTITENLSPFAYLGPHKGLPAMEDFLDSPEGLELRTLIAKAVAEDILPDLEAIGINVLTIEAPELDEDATCH